MSAFLLISAFICLSLSQVIVNPNTVLGSCTVFSVHADANINFDASAATNVGVGNIGAFGAVTGMFTPSTALVAQSDSLNIACASENNAIFNNTYTNLSTDAAYCNSVPTGASFPAGSKAPGVYCINSGSDLVLSGAYTFAANVATDQFFVLSAFGITFDSTFTMSLTGGATPENIFFLANGVINIADGRSVTGNLLGSSNITVGAGATVTGRLIAESNIFFSGAATVVPATFTTSNPTVAPTGAFVPTLAPTMAPTSSSSGLFASFALMFISAFLTL